MTSPSVKALLVSALVLALAGCDRNPATQSQSESPASEAPAAAPAEQAVDAPAPIPPATELQVEKVDSVMLSRPPDAPASIVVRVSGTVASAGWTDPKLAPVEASITDPAIRIYSFVATSPEVPGDSRIEAPVETQLQVDDLPPEVRTIRVVSATNAISAPVVQ